MKPKETASMHTYDNTKILVSASVSCMNLYNLEQQMQEVEDSGVSFLHFDVVDGYFNNVFILGLPTLQAIRPHTRLPIEVHLGVNEPERFIRQFADAGADYIAVHYENKDPEGAFRMILDSGARPVLALRAETDAEEGMKAYLPYIPWVLKLTVNPGFSGQTIQPEAIEKIRNLRNLIEGAGCRTGIQADGNMSPANIPRVREAGANIFTGGTSGLFIKGVPISEACRAMQDAAQTAQPEGRKQFAGTD